MAKNFRSSTGIKSFPLLWDQSRQSWRELGVFAQPAWVLFDADGIRLTPRVVLGGISRGAVLTLIAA